MKRNFLKIVICFLLVIALLSRFSKVNALDTTEDMKSVILEKADEKIIYFKNMNSVDFKYAVADNQADAISKYEPYRTDTNGNRVAIITNDETAKKVYIKIANDENVYSIDIEEIPAITFEEINEIKELTTKINVDTTKTYTYETIKEDTKITTTVGKVTISDEDKDEYVYQNQELIEIVDKNGTIKNTNEKAQELYEKLKELQDLTQMYEILTTQISIRDNLKQLFNGAWKDTKDLEIIQPEDAVNDEKFLVLIQKLDNSGRVIIQDIQFMTAKRIDNMGVEETQKKETTIVEKKVQLPVTGEQIAIYLSLGVVLIAIVLIIIRLHFLNKKEEKIKAKRMKK